MGFLAFIDSCMPEKVIPAGPKFDGVEITFGDINLLHKRDQNK